MERKDTMQYPAIEKGIPIPPKYKYTCGQKDKWRGFVEKLQVGDSFTVYKPNMHTLFYNYGVILKMRHIGNNKYRYWVVRK